MKFLNFIYLILTIIAAIGAFGSGTWLAISGILGPFMCWWAGSGTRGMFFHHRYLAGLIVGALTFALGVFLIDNSGYQIKIGTIWLMGYEWCIVGFLVGFVATSRKDAEVEENEIENSN